MRWKAKVVVALLWLHTGAALSSFQSAPSQWIGDSPREPSVAQQQPAETRIDSKDPVRGVNIVYPVEGAVEMSPIVFGVQINVRSGGEKLFAAQYDGASICVEVNGATIFCSSLHEPAYQYHHDGNCTARAYLKLPRAANESSQNQRFRSSPVSFTLLGQAEFNEHVARVVHKNDEKHRPGYQLSLVEWAQSQQRQPDREILQRLERDKPSVGIEANDSDSEEFLLVVGVRTAVVSHFPFRQAIRETWASSSALPRGVKVLFLGCRPHAVLPDEDSPHLHRRLLEAVELEKQVYGDLLTDELDCDDAYIRLADKTKEFLHLAATMYPHAQYAMVADDDIYLRLDKIASWLQELGPRKRFYAGHVREIENARKTPPTRIVGSPHYLSKETYPLSELPPFALGANFFLSMDCVQFVSKNRRRLRDLGGMDDISVALWMLTRQVHPIHRKGLQHLRVGPCKDNLDTLSDLSASSIRLIHTNLLSQRRFCHGFDRHVWMWQNKSAAVKGSYQRLAFSPETLHFDVSRETEQQVVVTISTLNHAGIKLSYFPFRENLDGFSRRLCALSRLSFPVARIKCADFTERVRSAIQSGVRG